MKAERGELLTPAQARRVIEKWARRRRAEVAPAVADLAEALGITAEEAGELLDRVRACRASEEPQPQIGRARPLALWGGLLGATALCWGIGLQRARASVHPSDAPPRVVNAVPPPGSSTPAPFDGLAARAVEGPVPPPPSGFPVMVFQGDQAWVAIPMDEGPEVRPLSDSTAVARVERTRAALTKHARGVSDASVRLEARRRAREHVARERRQQEEATLLKVAQWDSRHMPPPGVRFKMLGRVRGGASGWTLKLVPVDVAAVRAKAQAFVLQWLREDYLRQSHRYEYGPLPDERDLRQGYDVRVSVGSAERRRMIPTGQVRALAKSGKPSAALLASLDPLLDFVEERMLALNRIAGPEVARER